MARIVMFVLNDVRHDARVRREAATLTAAGHAVTIVGRPSDPAGAALERDEVAGVPVLRVPVPGRLRRRLLMAGGGRRTTGPGDAARSSAARRVIRLALGLRHLPVIGPIVDGVDLLLRWRLGVEAWGRAAAVSAPIADIWLAHDLTAAAAAVLARRRHGGRLVLDLHELYLDAGDTATRPGWARAILRRVERRAIAGADAVVTVNDALAAAIREIADPRRLIVVHNAPAAPPPGATPSALRAASPLRAALGLGEDARVALYHGSLAAGRGVEVLLAALAEPGLGDVHAVFLGAGAASDAIAQAAADPHRSGRVHHLGPVDPDAVTAWVAGADVGVMAIQPTTENHRRSTPNKLFECLAAGVPVVASDFPAIRAIVDPGVGTDAALGVVVDPTDVVAVAAGLRHLLDLGASARAGLAERCLTAARTRWNWEAESAGLVALMADLVPAPGGAPVPQRVTLTLPTSGAFDSRTQRIAVALAARGHDVLVIARAGDGLPADASIAPGATLRRVGAGRPVAATPVTSRGLARLIREALRILATASAARAQSAAAAAVDRPADIYHAMGFLGLRVARDLGHRNGAPVVYDARDLYAESNNLARLPWPVRAVFAWTERRWARSAAAVLTVNASLAAELARRFGIDPPTVVLNGQSSALDPGAPTAPAASAGPEAGLLRAACGLDVTTRLILYHGALMRDRGLPQLIAAMLEPGLKSAHLAIMGDGPISGELDALIAAHGLGARVHRLPPVPPSDLLSRVAEADVGAMPNQPRTFNERLSTPNKLFECLAAGVPVVSSDFPERRRIILEDPDGPLGALCDPTSPGSIAAAVRAILDLEPAARADLRARCARAAAERYSWDSQLPGLLAAYARVTGRPW